MSYEITFHPLVQRDLNEILEYYELEASVEIADRFESEVRDASASIRKSPRHHPFYLKQRLYRRCSLTTFPHLILFREKAGLVQVIVLKHVRRAPGYGLRRR